VATFELNPEITSSRPHDCVSRHRLPNRRNREQRYPWSAIPDHGGRLSFVSELDFRDEERVEAVAKGSKNQAARLTFGGHFVVRRGTCFKTI
jgi:hypothetical protein